ncbi:MAG: fibronectin type III domain-containing protein, partial [Candidatus Aminicenantaceae bacterium]
VPNTTLSYKDKGLPTDTKYWYRLKSYSEFDEESEDPSNAVTENWIWPALDPLLNTQFNRFLFYQEKINTISWSGNPLNDAITVDRYDIYRKLTSQTNAEFTLLTSMGPDIYMYKDRGLPMNESYTYRIVVVDADGVESAPSEAVSEE